jgi:NAD-dependent SIR2 family protein deacetylase
MTFISITMPAKYGCIDCDHLFYEPRVELKRRGRYYYRTEHCPACGSKKIETAAIFRMRKVKRCPINY